jgi:hypothetical protein
MRSLLHSSSLRRALAVVIGVACTSCGSKDPPRSPGDRKSAPPSSCVALLGSWTEVEPTEGTTIDEPDEDKLRAVSSGRRLEFERGRLTITTSDERLDSRIVMEEVTDGRCLLRARDTLGRAIEIDVNFASQRLMRLHNVLEPKSPPSLFQRR